MTSGRASRLPSVSIRAGRPIRSKLDLVDKLEAVAAEAGRVIKAPRSRLCRDAPRRDLRHHRTKDDGPAHGPPRGREVTLDDATLDRFDEIVPPGVTLNPADAGWQPESVTEAWRRRRSFESRAAG